jgi:hypothetical protein
LKKRLKNKEKRKQLLLGLMKYELWKEKTYAGNQKKISLKNTDE